MCAPLMRRVPQSGEAAHRTHHVPSTHQAGFADVSARDGIGRERLDDSLLNDPFLKQLQREKRRADRSKSHLSIILFRFDGRKDLESRNSRQLFDLLRNTRRETDILGRLSDNLVGILLPDTNKLGAKVFLEKIVGRAETWPFRPLSKRTRTICLTIL